MGLRTHRYGPVITSSSVGATGAGVPRPSPANLTNASPSTAAPPTMINTPMTARELMLAKEDRTAIGSAAMAPRRQPRKARRERTPRCPVPPWPASRRQPTDHYASDLPNKQRVRRGYFRRAFADSRLLAFCNALTSSPLLIAERPGMSSLVASSYRCFLEALASTPPAVGRLVSRPPSACGSDGPLFSFGSQRSPTFSWVCFNALESHLVRRSFVPFVALQCRVVGFGKGVLRFLAGALQGARQLAFLAFPDLVVFGTRLLCNDDHAVTSWR